MDASLQHVRVVLVRPQGAANVGAAARAMKNMGVSDLALVAPAMRREFLAAAMAVHARDVLAAGRTFSCLPDAIADCQLVVGTTCRGGPYRAAAEPLADAAPALLRHAAAGPVALVFGPEDHGLSNEDLRSCQRLVTIGTSDGYPSLNVAQAVLLCCYELRRARERAAAVEPAAPVATAGTVEQMLERLQAALLAIGFLHPQNPDHIMLAVRQLFGRTTLDVREVRILLGLARQIEWSARTRRADVPSPSLEEAV